MSDALGKENSSSRENSGVFRRQTDISRLPFTSAGSIAEVDPKLPLFSLDLINLGLISKFSMTWLK